MEVERAREVLTQILSAYRWARPDEEGDFDEALKVLTRNTTLTNEAAPAGEDWPLRARVYERDSTGEWVLEIAGVIDDTSMVCRHTEPLSTPKADVPGLPSLYEALAPQTTPDVGVLTAVDTMLSAVVKEAENAPKGLRSMAFYNGISRVRSFLVRTAFP